MSALEHRYRRLLALYPAAHRRRYQLEMLSTLMDGADENQRSPRLRETIDLVWNAIWLRLNRDGAPVQRDPRWAEAATIFGGLGAMVITAIHLMAPLGQVAWDYRLRGLPVPFDAEAISWVPFAQAGAWLAVAVIAVLGGWRIAAGVGWTAVLLTTAWALREYPADPPVLVREWTLIVFGAVVAGCLSIAKGPIALRTRHMAIFGGVSAAGAMSLWADAMLAHVRIYPGAVAVDTWGQMGLLSIPGQGFSGLLPNTLVAAFLVTALWLLVKVDARVRRRLVGYASVPVATYVFVRVNFDLYVLRSQRSWDEKLPLGAPDWMTLILPPLAAFALAVIVVRRKDTQQRLIELGRAASQ